VRTEARAEGRRAGVRTHWPVAVIVTALVAAAIAGRFVSDGPGPDVDGGVEAQQFAAALAPWASDYDPAAGPVDLANRSQVVVLGRIVALREGRSFADGPEQVWSGTAVMEVAVERVLAGELSDPEHSSIYVELFRDLRLEATALDAMAPKEARVLLYVNEIPDPPTADPGYLPEAVINAGAGRPAGQPLVFPTTPQGFLMETDQHILQVYGGFSGEEPKARHRRLVERSRSLDILDFAPPNLRFPGPNN
jgi:hypothetical protein